MAGFAKFIKQNFTIKPVGTVPKPVFCHVGTVSSFTKTLLQYGTVPTVQFPLKFSKNLANFVKCSKILKLTV